ncbi:MAG TPA: 5-formyltetrahydrofolate cyclo-ligase [Pseudidiomarina sp.]|nr:5-formyltetrahydrofolate cyclo-ligase [Pseudidiomarina sp.]
MEPNKNEHNSTMRTRQLRRELLTARASLSSAERQAAAAQIMQRLQQLPEFQQPIRVGSYVSVHAEVSTQALNQWLLQAHQLAVPVLHPFRAGNLLFLNVTPNTQWHSNAFKIPEPKLRCPDIAPLATLDVLLVPLVGFDRHGNRLGMGGGYYDRTLAAWQAGRLPRLLPIGLAYDQQCVASLPAQAWDVPLPRIITPTKLWDFRR